MRYTARNAVTAVCPKLQREPRHAHASPIFISFPRRPRFFVSHYVIGTPRTQSPGLFLETIQGGSRADPGQIQGRSSTSATIQRRPLQPPSSNQPATRPAPTKLSGLSEDEGRTRLASLCLPTAESSAVSEDTTPSRSQSGRESPCVSRNATVHPSFNVACAKPARCLKPRPAG